MHPVVNPFAPVFQTTAPEGIAGHDAAVATRITDGGEGVNQPFAEEIEKGFNLFPFAIGVVGINKAVILIRAQQHFAPAATAHDNKTKVELGELHAFLLDLLQHNFVAAFENAVMKIGEDLHDFDGRTRLVQ